MIKTQLGARKLSHNYVPTSRPGAHHFSTMLFKTISELVDLLPVDQNFEFDLIKPFIETAEADFIKDILGTTEYTNLESAYQDSTLTAAQTDLLPYCQKALAFLAFDRYIPIGNVDVSDQGIRFHTDEGTKQAFSWQVADLQTSLEETGYNHLQTLLQFLWANAATYTDWAGSTNSAKYRSHFINSATDFNEFVDIKNSFRTFWILRPSLRTIEDTVIEANLERWSAGKYAEMLNAIKAGTALTDDNLAVYNLLVPALAHLAAAHAAHAQSIEINSQGVVQKSTAGHEKARQQKPVDRNRVFDFASARSKDGETYLAKLSTKIDVLLAVEDDNDATTDGYNDTDRGIFGML